MLRGAISMCSDTLLIHILDQREPRPGMTGPFPSLGPGLFAVIEF